jgi:hypothetical protein
MDAVEASELCVASALVWLEQKLHRAWHRDVTLTDAEKRGTNPNKLEMSDVEERTRGIFEDLTIIFFFIFIICFLSTNWPEKALPDKAFHR